MFAMIIVIIAGGSGTRLWPLSTPNYPKHLLKLNGNKNSLLQNTYNRAKQLGNKIYVITENSHAHYVKEQLNDLPEEHFIVEPARRGTANCIVAALAHLTDSEDEKEPIAILSADHFIRDIKGFEHSFMIAGEASEKEGRIVLVGVEPTYPATGFGYIKKDNLFDEKRFVYNVNSFKEKPPFETANAYIKSGNYLWNCGYFVGSLKTFKDKMKAHAPYLLRNYESLISASDKDYHKKYLGFENNTIDYDLIEHVEDLLVVPATFDWMDIGSYNDLHKALESDNQGNHVSGGKIEISGVENSIIRNDEDKPLAVIGLDNVAVINTPHGVLVTRKDLAQHVGEVSKRFQSN